MARSSPTRRLVVGADTYLWSVRHLHEGGKRPDISTCRETLSLRQEGSSGRLVLAFHQPPAIGPTSTVGDPDRGWLNLHEPGVVRAFLDAALAQGWQPGAKSGQEIDGWTLFPEALRARRAQSDGGADTS
ncbi:hypothetical protein [Streptomyces lonegramiae]|uniref:Uncharacterized protein n=1 Tax=Streptomyces lonegramiae TaxID=3075524 RepID=A0ABU2XE13_9ACTN|nr:hypothetical protein [Streptomyces sp. DSM 41529]MDT0544148.1 hypothetical protein [Streptomyces sp. DSM 41529]